MLSIKEKGILLYIINHCKRVEEKVTGLTCEDFDSDKDVEEIVCFNILQIGELAKRLSPEFIKKYNAMPWDDIKGMRDIVAHQYGTIKFDDVWKTASQEIKPLRA